MFTFLSKIRKMSVKNLFPPGLEPGTFRVLGERDNHYTTETWMYYTLCISSVIVSMDTNGMTMKKHVNVRHQKKKKTASVSIQL